jgi:hypothetical protein
MVKNLGAVAILLFSLGIVQTTKADIQTLAEFSGTLHSDPGPYQPPTVVGTFNIIPDDTSITISGTFGNTAFPDSGGVDVFLGSIEVAQCIEFAACWTSGRPIPWSDTLTAAQITTLGVGVVDLTAVQTAEFTTRLGPTTLDQVSAPEPASVILLFTLLLAAGLATRKRIAQGFPSRPRE